MPLLKLQAVRLEVEALYTKRDQNAPYYGFTGDQKVDYARLLVEEASLMATLAAR